jgi:hypothetical protein
MATINYSDVTGPILNGRTADKVNLHTGYLLREAVGYAKIDTTLRTNISVYVPSSQAQTPGESINSPDQLLILPAGAVVARIGLRLPKIDPNTTTQYGNLRKGATLIGTTGELVKVGYGTTFTNTAPSIAAASSVYAPDATATVQRGLAGADVTLSGLVTTGAATPVNLLVSNAGSSAAGTGIATSAGVAFAIVQVCWYEIQPALRYEDLGYISSIKGV